MQGVDMPRDGTYYGPDVRALFPLDMQQRIFDQAFDITGMAARLTIRRAQLRSKVITPMPLAMASPITTSPNLNLGKLAYVQGGDIWVKSLPNGQPHRLC